MTDPTRPNTPGDPDQQPTPPGPYGDGPSGPYGPTSPGPYGQPPSGPIATGPMQPMPGPGGPTQSTWTPEPPAAPPRRRQWIPIAVLLVIVVGIGGAFWLFRDRLSGDVGSLQVGDCIDEPSTSGGAVSDVQHQPCNDPHDAEIFALVTHTAASGAAYPPATEFDDLVGDECYPRLERYTGRNVLEVFAAGFTVGYLYPTSSGWAGGDRGVTCYVTKTDDSKMTGSVRAPAAPASGTPTSAPGPT